MTDNLQHDATTLDWLLKSDEPWTRYRTLVDLLDIPKEAPEVQEARAVLVAHPQVQALIEQAASWPGYVFKRHNDAAHPIYALSTLADFGLRASDPEMEAPIEAVLAHQAPEGPFESLINIPKTFGGTGEDTWGWMLCDAPTLLYALLAYGLDEDPQVERAVEHLVAQVKENGWRCEAAPVFGKFHGPGRRADPCPIVNVYALKALAQAPQFMDSPATRAGVEMLLDHWEHQKERKIYLFAMGTHFRRLKYPFVWYDLLHVTDVLSRFPFARDDPRFAEMLATLTEQADEEGRYTAGSMFRAWKGWSFADKKQPSPWITLLALRVQRRAAA